MDPGVVREVDLIGMALAGFGLIGPVIAAIIHVGSESTFILNSARLIPTRTSTHPRPTTPNGLDAGSPSALSQ